MSTIDPPAEVSRLPDADMQAAPAALARAARRARELAARSGTPLVVSENGRVIEKSVVSPDPEPLNRG
jgi:hypothetical protein